MENSRIEILKLNLAHVKQGLINPTKLVVVSKTYPDEDIKLCYQLGERDFGENHVVELEQKALILVPICPDIRFHMIGHLQTNKIKKLFKISNLVAIHSVDSLHLVEELLKEEKNLSSPYLNLFLQIKTSDEEEKYGFTEMAEIKKAIFLLQEKSTRLKLHGLMTMGKIRTDDIQGDAKKCFEKLINFKAQIKESFSELNLSLSMGMSSDFEIASSMGSDYVRIGSKIFGSRG